MKCVLKHFLLLSIIAQINYYLIELYNNSNDKYFWLLYTRLLIISFITFLFKLAFLPFTINSDGYRFVD